MAFSVLGHGKTDVGRKRDHNEDAFFVDDATGLYIVADGMGGHAAGEVASAEAIDQIVGMVRRGSQTIEDFKENPTAEHRQAVRRVLESAVQAATYMVFGIGELNPEQQGMGTTISTLLLVGGWGFVAQVGDSRVYLVRDKTALQLTEDHTLVNLQVKLGMLTPEQAKASSRSNVITRAVGVKDYVEVDTFELQCRHGDRFLLCSDGLHEYVDDPVEIAEVLSSGNLVQAANRFIDLANERGGKDNITSVLAMVADL